MRLDRSRKEREQHKIAKSISGGGESGGRAEVRWYGRQMETQMKIGLGSEKHFSFSVEQIFVHIANASQQRHKHNRIAFHPPQLDGMRC